MLTSSHEKFEKIGLNTKKIARNTKSIIWKSLISLISKRL